MMKGISKIYDSKNVEDKLYKIWEKSGYFNPDNLNLPSNSEKFVISMPPPNATGTLHLGHALMLAYQDLMIRYNRMNGKIVLWLPGTDHAAIATQTKVEKIILEKEGKTRHKFGRSNFLKYVEKYVEESRNIIRNQVKKMGSSCDWSRERYTLDENLSYVVKEVFFRMYKDGLIYRGNRIVNWCPRCESTLSDDEIEYKEEKGKLYWLNYGPFIIATSRPETKLGDTAVAVHPDDKRYKDKVGKSYNISGVLGKFKVKVVADKSVDPSFGSGAVKVTPAHSLVDYEISLRHNLPMKQIIDKKGCMMKNCGKYAGISTEEARKKIVSDMEKLGLINRIDKNYIHNIAVCYRCKAKIEPIPSLQWFVDVDKKISLKNNKYFKNKSLKEVSIEVVKNGEIEIIPGRFKKMYFRWMKNLHNWCISRQIWFGHKIPILWCKNKNCKHNKKTPILLVDKSKNCPECGSSDFINDKDTLDTWFSSGMWTFSTLLDKNYKKYKTFDDLIKNSGDFKKFHPTSVMETGYDILFFWVARMILMTTYTLGDIPFRKVYLHGMVRDKLGRKMSKSLGNGIDPIDMIKKYGTDAVRLSMIIGSSPGGDVKLYEEKIAGYRNFVNKLWNISRYILMSVESVKIVKNLPKPRTLSDKWILCELNNVIKTSKKIEEFHFSAIAEDLYNFTWNKFADWYIEISKIEKHKDEILLYVLEKILIMWHPFIPFVTEEIWKNFNSKEILMIRKWPKYNQEYIIDETEKNNFKMVQDIVVSIRNLRFESKINPSKKIKVVIASKNKNSVIENQSEIIKFLSGLESVDIRYDFKMGKNLAAKILSEAEIYLPLSDNANLEKLKSELKKDVFKVKENIARIENNLRNKNFISKAPSFIVERNKNNLIKTKERLDRLRKKLDLLS